ncbi:fimbrial biogenesis chaperone [Paraburkholderia dinghuensis]|uniref:Molecular chaperone n=1 Tax=Paraburkholderia dinghuensis TaxID=2305225 RepID=A0A3N6MTY7_9BURK|nr:molecular chaperone [Paraburkholderia dinghuensis]RQH07119.1 molecular chaperone [Paraburkholderia dinghuensis]
MFAIKVRNFIRYSAYLLILGLHALIPLSASAGVVMYGTRIIYPAGTEFVTARFANHDRAPNLMQVWVDDGKGVPPTNAEETPFFVAPPLFRINAGSEQTVRIIFNSAAAALPADRETLFWLNFLQIPPNSALSQQSGTARITISFLNQVKLIYRPSGIKGDVGDLAKNIRFGIRKEKGDYWLEASNQTGYYATFMEDAAVKSGNDTHPVKFDKNVTLAPFSSISWKLSGHEPISSPSTVEFSLIDDRGNARMSKADISL